MSNGNFFIVNFYDVNGNTLWKRSQKKFSVKLLLERAKDQKPLNVFRFRRGSYVYNSEAIEDYTSKGLPILKYVYGKSEPFTFHALNSGKQIKDICQTNALLMDTVLSRGEVKNVIMASMKSLEHKFGIMEFVFGIAIGGFAVWILYSMHVI